MKKGDRVLLANADSLTGKPKYGIVIKVKTEECEEFTTYNLEVEDFHTYYVGENGICVHNVNCGGLDIYDKLDDSPYYDKRFVSDGSPDIAKINKPGLEPKLQSRYPGDWVKVYDYGTINGSYAEFHYFARQVGYNQFDKFFFIKLKILL